MSDPDFPAMGAYNGPSQHVRKQLKRGTRKIGEEAVHAQETGSTGSLFEYREAFAEDYMKELVIAIERGASHSEKFFVYIVRKNDAVLPNVYRQIFFDLSQRPQAQPNTDCWYIDTNKREMELLWTLPTRPAIMQMAVSGNAQADSFLVHCCKEFLDGRLNTEYDSIILAGRADERRRAELERDSGKATAAISGK